MKYIPILLLIMMLPFFLTAQPNLSCSFSPQMVEVNTMNTASFDPYLPQSQPILTYLNIVNSGDKGRLDLRVKVLWNDRFLIGSIYQSIDSLLTNGVITLTNRDLITNQSSQYFEQKPGAPAISVSDAISANSLFGDAVLAGYFPDGDLQIRVAVRPYEDSPWDFEAPHATDQLFTIRIRNAGEIKLVSPGVPLGTPPPSLSQNPLSFFWNAPETGLTLNTPILTIREFPPTMLPNVNNVETTGNLFYQNTTVQNGFSDYLPFNSGNYYAWKVSKALSDEYNPQLPPKRSAGSSQALSADWFIFRYVSGSETDPEISEFQARLNMLNNNKLINLYTEGYTPVGVIIFEGRSYSGQEALNLIDTLLGQDIDVQLKD